MLYEVKSHTGARDMTIDDFTYIQTQLDSLKREIEQGAYIGYPGDSPTDGWGGAGIGFSTVPIELGEPGFYPDPLIVVTPHAHAAGWLLNRLCRIFIHDRLIIGCSKEEFFGRLANAALRYQRHLANKRNAARELLKAMYSETWIMLNEGQKRSFTCQ